MTKRLVASLLALVVVIALCCFGTLAEEESIVSADTSVETTESVDDSADTASEADTSAAESSDASATESGDTSVAESTDASTDTSTEDSTAATSNTPWGLIIVCALIVIFVIVCIICAKVQNKFGLWVIKVLRDYKSEFKKITWLSPKDLLKQTGVVLVILIAAAVVLGLLDWGFSSLINLLSNI